MNVKRNMFCPGDGQSERYCDEGNQWGAVNYPKKEDMVNVTNEFPLISSNSKYEIMKGERTGYHSEWGEDNEGNGYYYQVNDKNDYYAIYYNGKKIDDLVRKSVHEFSAYMHNDNVDKLKTVLDKFDVSTLVVDDYFKNNRNEHLICSAYLHNAYKVLDEISDCRPAFEDGFYDFDDFGRFNDLHTKVIYRLNEREPLIDRSQDADSIAKIASVTCFTPNKSNDFYNNINSVEPQQNKGLKKFKNNVSCAYSCIKAISFYLVEKKLLHKDKKMTTERVSELCKDTMKLNQTYKKPIDSEVLLSAINKLPEIENFIALDHTYDDVKRIFRAAKKSIKKERSKSSSNGR